MNDILQKVLDFCEARVKAGDIYVWGGSGQKASAITETWIREKEARNQGGKNADRAIRTWQKRINAGFKAFRAYDCSGYISAALISVNALDKRRDCDGLWARCEAIETAEDGALLFHVNSANFEDETHVGIYFNGYQYHAKGRDDGVVKEHYDPSEWAKIGWLKALPRESIPQEVEEPEYLPGGADPLAPPYVQIIDSVNVRNPAGKGNKIIYVAHDERLFFTGIDPKTKWFAVDSPNGPGFVSCDIPRYAQLVER